MLEVTDILPTLFGHVLIPPAVCSELQRVRTPAMVRTWFANPPSWVHIQPPHTLPDPTLSALGDGEREAIQLLREQRASLLVTDDRNAYKAALARGIPVTRTLRLLEMATERGLVDLPTIVTRLQAAEFYMPADVVEEMLTHDAERKRQQSSSHSQ